MSSQPDNRRYLVDDAQRVAGIRFRLDARRQGFGAGGDINTDVSFLLDRCDALRAKLADAHVEPYWTERHLATFEPST